MELKIGDYVKIKEGTKLDSGELINDWHGFVEAIMRDDGVCLVIFDAKTINSLSDEYLMEHVEEVMEQEPFECYFEIDELEKSERRDTDKELETAIENLTGRVIKAERAYEEKMENLKHKWTEEFESSDQFASMTEYQKENGGFVVDSFMSFIKNYEYVNPIDWDRDNVIAVCLEIIPRKITDKLEFFENYGDVLISFFSFLGQSEYIINSEELIKAVKKIKGKIPEIANNSDNWGMAKSMMISAQEGDFDISDEDDLQDFKMNFNENLNHENNSAKVIPLRPDPFRGIGRNQKISVKYNTDEIVNDIKFKKVESDLRNGLCVIFPDSML